MATFFKTNSDSHATEREGGGNGEFKKRLCKTHNPFWFSVETGVYNSTHPSIKLADDPFLDVVSFIFSHKHHGGAALVDSSSGISISYSQLYPMVKSMATGLHKRGVAQGIPVISVSKSNGWQSFYEMIWCEPNWDLRPKISQQDTAAILYSSGTTGACKGVILTHQNFIAMIELFVRFEASQYEYLTTKNVYLDIIPMFHVYGLSLFVMGLLSLGSTVVVMRKFDADAMVKAIERYGVTHFPVAPPLLMALTRSAKGGAVSSLRSLKQVSCGAAPTTTKCVEDFVQALPNVDFIQGYGMTESTAVGTRGYNTGKLRNYSSVGLLAPNMQAKIVDWISGSALPPNGMGELWLHGPAVMKGYLNNKEHTRSMIDDDGWLHTGDIAYFDQDGYLYVIDRLKEIIKYKGFQIAPADLEAILVSHPDIIDAAVTGARDEEAGEIPVAIVVKRDGCALSQAGVIDFVSKQVAPYKKIRSVYFRASIPRSTAGKILRKELRNLLTSKM